MCYRFAFISKRHNILYSNQCISCSTQHILIIAQKIGKTSIIIYNSIINNLLYSNYRLRNVVILTTKTLSQGTHNIQLMIFVFVMQISIEIVIYLMMMTETVDLTKGNGWILG